MYKPFISVALATALLAGCAGVQTISSDVSSFAEWPPERKAGTYAFERLPSQEAQAPETEKLEAAARPALQKAGFQPVAAGTLPDVLVQVGATTTRYDWGDPYGWPGYGYGYGYYRGARWGGPYWGSPYWGWGGSMYYNRPRYDREVAVLVRDRTSGKPLFESHATTTDSYSTDTAMLTAMFEAALADFPYRGINPRRVVVPLVR